MGRIIIRYIARSLVGLAAVAASGLVSGVERAPDGLTASEWSQIRAAYERHRYSAVVEPSAAAREAYRAHNLQQQWLTRFDGRGFVVEPDQGGWAWGLEFAGYGFDGAEQAVEGKVAIHVDNNRVSYRWSDAVEEWYVNEAKGLEHGFTVGERPPGRCREVAVPAQGQGVVTGPRRRY